MLSLLLGLSRCILLDVLCSNYCNVNSNSFVRTRMFCHDLDVALVTIRACNFQNDWRSKAQKEKYMN